MMQYSCHEFGILDFSSVPHPHRAKVEAGLVGGGEEGETQSSCPEKHTPSFGCLHLLGISVAVSIATGVKEVGMSQRYGVPSAVDC